MRSFVEGAFDVLDKTVMSYGIVSIPRKFRDEWD